jgi:ABC-type polar amino acid transport system ATPase subunit
MDFAREVADRVIFMDQGEFIEDTTPDVIFTQPRDQRTRDFLSRIL